MTRVESVGIAENVAGGWDHIVSTLSNKQKVWSFFFSYRGDNSWSGRDDVALPQGSDRKGKGRKSWGQERLRARLGVRSIRTLA